MSISVAEAALMRHRHERGLVSPCGADWDDHHWHGVLPDGSLVPIAVICVHCGVLANELLEQAPVDNFHDV